MAGLLALRYVSALRMHISKHTRGESFGRTLSCVSGAPPHTSTTSEPADRARELGEEATPSTTGGGDRRILKAEEEVSGTEAKETLKKDKTKSSRLQTLEELGKRLEASEPYRPYRELNAKDANGNKRYFVTLINAPRSTLREDIIRFALENGEPIELQKNNIYRCYGDNLSPHREYLIEVQSDIERNLMFDKSGFRLAHGTARIQRVRLNGKRFGLTRSAHHQLRLYLGRSVLVNNIDSFADKSDVLALFQGYHVVGKPEVITPRRKEKSEEGKTSFFDHKWRMLFKLEDEREARRACRDLHKSIVHNKEVEVLLVD